MEFNFRFDANGVGDLEILSEDSGVVFGRCRRESSGDECGDVLIVLPATEQPTPAVLGRLAHEYSFKDELDSAWAVRPLALVQDRGRTILVLEDPGGEALGRLLGTPMAVGRFLPLAAGMAAALGKMHQHGLIHKDIKPANVLVNIASGEVHLTGFGNASRLMRERQSAESPESIGGSFAYMAPEQTGRMNRSVDSRSDLYSLGVTFYEMLTGSLPFSASDPMEWVHCHIARKPVPPNARLDSVPDLLSTIVMKLLAKTAEERYQTAGGVERDLRRCLSELETRGRIDEFPLAERDVPDRLVIPEKLYGRSREIATLVGSFHRVVATGVPELVLVSGYSGIGKSSLVNELQKELTRPRGLFASGKFDQYKRDIPYATVAQAFQNLVRQTLSKSEVELNAVRDALREALGPHGRLIMDLIPELELVIGEQPPVPDLLPQDAQRHFQSVLRRFIAVFARPEHPLVLFLDDLQWLDAATLDLLEDILTQREIRHLLLIGAYRDNEVDVAHPLVRRLDAMRRAGAAIQDVVLTPLTNDDLGQLISDSLHCEAKPAKQLVRLVYEKTGGNPFFAIQFLSALADEALLIFDQGDARWICDLGRIRAKRYTDNVIDLMIVKLNRLPHEAQSALRQLACIGSRAECALLAIACQVSQEDLHDNLWEAVRSGMVLRSENSYSFQHDRIQEASYSLVSDEARAEAHLRIGRVLLAHTPPEKREEIIFDIVSQLNRGVALITARDERDQLVQLNLTAGKRAIKAAAYSSALTYFEAGRAFLSDDSRTRQYPLTFELDLRQAECELMTGEMVRAEEQLSSLASRAKTLVDLAAVTALRVDLYIMLARSERAVDVGLEYLAQFGIKWSSHPTDDDVGQEYKKLWQLLGTRSIEDLIGLPLMSDTGAGATMNVLTKLMPSANNTDNKLNCLLILRMVNLSLEFGNSNASCFGYVSLASILITDFGDSLTALRFAQLSLDLVEKHGLDAFKARIYLRFGIAISPLMHHVRSSRAFLLRARDETDKIGDVLYAGHCRSHVIKNLIFSGEPLNEVEQEEVAGLDFARSIGSNFIFVIILNKLYLIRRLKGQALDLRLFDDTKIDEGEYEQYLEADSNLTYAACAYWTRKLQACVFVGDFASALNAVARAQSVLLGPSLIERAEYHFYAALTLAASVDTVGDTQPKEQASHREALTAHHRQLQIWTEHCPENFENRAALIGAEIARIDDRVPDAQQLYEQAIRSARANGFIHNEALACETAARFYAARGFEDIAEMYFGIARDCYLRWGADGKVRQLDARYPRVATSNTRYGTMETTSRDQQYDLASVMKASQALSSEMLLPRLIEQLMTIALQNAGADRGQLILPSEDKYLIRAEARTDGNHIEVTMRQEPITGIACPESLVRYVIRSREDVILDDASKPNMFSDDDYLRERQSKSILCLPLIKQQQLTGILLLENTLTSHAFTADRIAVLELIAAQAAISLENSRLYGELLRAGAELRLQVELLEQLPVSAWTLKPDGTPDFVNRIWLEFAGQTLDFVRSHPEAWMTAVHPEDREFAAKSFWKGVQSGQGFAFETRSLRARDGVYRRLLQQAVVLRDAEGKVFKFVGTTTDIDDQKRAEEALRQAAVELAHANRISTMGQLAASLAHEVNQPVGAALVNAGTVARWLGRQPPNVEEARQLNTRIIDDIRRVADIVGRIHGFSKKAQEQREDLEINDVIREIMTLARAAITGHGVSMKMQLAEKLPRISGDRVQLQQVILNLIMNAVEAMSEVLDGPRELFIGSTAALCGIIVDVRDSGPGLPPADPERVFEAFYTTKATGLGMGLAICRSIIEAHGGRLWASANVPKGAVLQFTLPATAGLTALAQSETINGSPTDNCLR